VGADGAAAVFAKGRTLSLDRAFDVAMEQVL